MSARQDFGEKGDVSSPPVAINNSCRHFIKVLINLLYFVKIYMSDFTMLIKCFDFMSVSCLSAVTAAVLSCILD